jgi:hypothetical protein
MLDYDSLEVCFVHWSILMQHVDLRYTIGEQVQSGNDSTKFRGGFELLEPALVQNNACVPKAKMARFYGTFAFGRLSHWFVSHQ